MNSDLLKKFQDEIERMDVSLEKIQVVLKNGNIEQKLMSSFSQARSGIRMEEPCRILTRLAFDLVKNLFASSPIPSCAESSDMTASRDDNTLSDPTLAAMNKQFENCHVKSSIAASSDKASYSHTGSVTAR